jgi:pyruvate dehydrogenase E2 component (dihydrolipoamide acetyltransferase)
MAILITVPRLGWSMEEGFFAGWHQVEGAQVRAGDPLFALEVEKATQDVESLDAGILRIPPDAPQPGDRVVVGQPLAWLLAPGEPAPWEQPAAGAAPVGGSSVSRPQPDEASSASQPAPYGAGVSPASPPAPRSRRAASEKTASPRARRLATQLGVDWRTLTGTGRNGRIRERDIRG